MGLFVLFGAITAAAFFLPAKRALKTSLPPELGGEPATCRELVERLQAKGMRLEWLPVDYGKGRAKSCPAVSIFAGKGDSEIILQAWFVQFPTPEEAREEAGAKPNAFSWGRFMIIGDEELLEEIKKRL